MGLKFLFCHLVTALVAVNFIFADEESDRFGLPFFGGASNSSGGFLGFPFFGGDGNGSGGLPSLPGFPNLPIFGFFGSRQERSADHHESDDDEQQDRLFFGSIASCNYTSQGGRTCSTCRQALACYPNNIGHLRTCRGLLRYCNNGRCSFIPGAECTNSTSNSTSTSTSNSTNNSTSNSTSSSTSNSTA